MHNANMPRKLFILKANISCIITLDYLNNPMSISYHLHLTMGSERSIALLRITQRERKDMYQSWSSQPPWSRTRKTMIRALKMRAYARQICSSCLKWYWPVRGYTREVYLETPAFDVRWWRGSLYTLPMVSGGIGVHIKWPCSVLLMGQNLALLPTQLHHHHLADLLLTREENGPWSSALFWLPQLLGMNNICLFFTAFSFILIYFWQIILIFLWQRRQKDSF